MIVESFPAIVVGSGLAGMTAALSMGSLRTLVVTKTEGTIGGSTPWAQGGVAFPRDAEDAPVHVHDTLVSGAGHGDPEAVQALISRAPGALRWLEDQGVAFDRDASGGYLFGREGAHSTRRILHVGADGTGSGLAATLAGRLLSSPNITLRHRTMALLLVPGGLLTFEEGRGLVHIRSPRIILAGGGLGQLFAATTAPAEGTGETMALALEAGAPMSDLEMVQYHPTALAIRRPGSPSLSLLTEALRGEGALLVTAENLEGTGLRPLDTGHPQGSLGPRDVLSRAIFRRQAAGFPVWLDARSVSESNRKFPTVTRLCAEVGLDPTRDLLPVVPAVHYTMGGIHTDLVGRTGLAGVWAVGENARTGVHGANRLASNSLLECVVWGRAAALDAVTAREHAGVEDGPTQKAMAEGYTGWRQPPLAFASALRSRIQTVMGQAAGPIRTAEGLTQGLKALDIYLEEWNQAAVDGPHHAELSFDQVRALGETKNLLVLGKAVLTRALKRTESLGAHYRED